MIKKKIIYKNKTYNSVLFCVYKYIIIQNTIFQHSLVYKIKKILWKMMTHVVLTK